MPYKVDMNRKPEKLVIDTKKPEAPPTTMPPAQKLVVDDIPGEQTGTIQQVIDPYHEAQTAAPAIVTQQSHDPMMVVEDEDESEDEGIILVVEDPENAEPRRTIPGSELELEDLELEDERDTDWLADKDHGKFMEYAMKMVDSIPNHSGQTTVGCERAISFLKKLDKEISRAIQTDEDNSIDEHEAETIRDQIMDFIDKLDDAHANLLDKKRKGRKKKKAGLHVERKVFARINDGSDIQYFIRVANGEDEDLIQVELQEPSNEQVELFMQGEIERKSLTKEAITAPVVLFEDPFMKAITRLLINSSTSAGKNIETVYADLKDKYNFTDREELSIQELLMQKGMPLFKDLGRLGDSDYQYSDGHGVDFATTYYA